MIAGKHDLFTPAGVFKTASKTFTELAGSLMKRYPAAVRRSRWNSPSGCFSAIMPTSHRDLLNPTPGRL
jgi:hypothetical protein